MRSVSSIMLKRINVLAALCVGFSSLVSAQTVNSPYSRYGIGDLLPSQNILNRGMGGVAAAYWDPQTINYLNPASYAYFISQRPVFDFGVELDNLTLRSTNPIRKFSNSSPIISYLNFGIPIKLFKKPIFGIAFGLRPVSRVNYRIFRTELLNSGTLNDSVTTLFEGSGGTQQAYFGTGVRLKDFSVGVNVGFLFGNKDYSTRRVFLTDTVAYYKSNHETVASIGGFVVNGGAQYTAKLNKKSWLRFGLQGNLQTRVNSRRDLIRETFDYDANGGTFRIDSVFESKDVKGKISLPTSYTAGIIYDRLGKFMIGVDYTSSKWSQYEFFGEKDQLQDSWQVHIGTQIFPNPGKNYFSNVAYRAGFSYGTDYVNVGSELKTWNVSVGAGLPLRRSQYSNQSTIINTALEIGQRGNNSNLVKESFYKISIGLSLNDIWFIKRQYK